MSKDNYDIFPTNLITLDNFEVLILKLPENELDDKLTYLTREKGNIPRTLYEDFIIANCIGNVNQLVSYINQTVTPKMDLIKIREELTKKILEQNSLLLPDNLVINKNYVVKIKRHKKIKEDEKLLLDNSSWNNSYYEDFNKPKNNKENIESKKEILKNKTEIELKNIKELEFSVKKVWWKRISKYVEVKIFKEEDIESILNKRYFHSPTSFNTFIVSVCIIDFEDLFAQLDAMGIPLRITPPVLIGELYELVASLNPFLTYANALKISGLKEEDNNTSCGNNGTRTASSGGMAQYGKTKLKKRFKDVPKEDLLKLEDNMKVFLVGQDEAINSLVGAIQKASIGLKDPNKPIGSFLFAGQTGVGKSHSCKILANELIKDKNNLIIIDCSEYSADHEYSKLIGAPNGYIGYEQGGYLTNAITKNPFCVVVFDEIEKASFKVHELMLQVLEDGRLTDGRGQSVSFKDTIIIMTSNIGVKEVQNISRTIGFGDVSKITNEKKDLVLNKALKEKFKPEFLNRLDMIINFKNLTKDSYLKIIEIELHKLNDNLRSNDTNYKNMSLFFDEEVKENIYKLGIDEQFGARPLKRCIEQKITTPLAKKILEEDIPVDKNIKVISVNDNIKFEVIDKYEDVPFYLSEQYQVQNEAVNGL